MMIGKSKYILVVALALCACSHPPTSPPSVKSLPPIIAATATIDFGVVPLWREADTIFTLHLNGIDSITLVFCSDSDFTLLSAPPTSRKQDSTISLIIRYQPESIANHTGSLVMIAGKDTVGLVSLSGGTSQFERHVGDSYVFLDSTGKTDSIWVSALPLTFSTRYSDDIDLIYRSVVLKQNGDWIVQPQPIPFPAANDTHVTLPVETLTATEVNWGGVFDTDYRFPTQGSYQTYGVHSGADPIAKTDSIAGHWFDESQITMSDAYYLKMRSTDMNFSGTFNGNYCGTIGFFVSYSQTSSQQGYYMGQYILKQSGSPYHLLRFHLRQ